MRTLSITKDNGFKLSLWLTDDESMKFEQVKFPNKQIEIFVSELDTLALFNYAKKIGARLNLAEVQEQKR